MEGNHDFGDEYPPLHPNCRCAIVGQSTVSDEEIANENAPEGDSAETTVPTEAIIPEPPVATNIAFASIDDAAKWFGSKDIAFDADKAINIGITADHMAEIANVMVQVDARYPGVIENLERINVKDIKPRSNGSIIGAQVGQLNTGKSELHLNSYFIRMMESNPQKWADNNFSSAKSWNDVYTHEMGHVVQNMAGLSTRVTSFDNPLNVALREAGYVGPTGRLLPSLVNKDVSTYASKNSLEFHAEASVIMNDAKRFGELPQASKDRLTVFRDALNRASGQTVLKAVSMKVDQDWSNVTLDADGTVVEVFDDFGFTEE
jgi:hypothetical protein